MELQMSDKRTVEEIEDKAIEVVDIFSGDFDIPAKLQEGLREEIAKALRQVQLDILESEEVKDLYVNTKAVSLIGEHVPKSARIAEEGLKAFDNLKVKLRKEL